MYEPYGPWSHFPGHLGGQNRASSSSEAALGEEVSGDLEADIMSGDDIPDNFENTEFDNMEVELREARRPPIAQPRLTRGDLDERAAAMGLSPAALRAMLYKD